jgi:hypothetical protein
MNLRSFALTVAAGLLALAPAAMNADTPGRHPAYLRARSDLRAAQFMMHGFEEPNVGRHLRQADHEVEAAIREIDRAAVLDRKDVEDHPRVDSSLDRRGRFGKAVELLRSARADLAREEDNGRAAGWRNMAFQHINEALENMHRAAVVMHRDHEFGL